MKRYMYTPAHFRALYAGLPVNAFSSDFVTLFPFEENDPLLDHLFSDTIVLPKGRAELFQIISKERFI